MIMSYLICKLQNASRNDRNSTPTIVIEESQPEWEQAIANWKQGKNPTDHPDWKKGVFALTKYVAQTS